MALDLRYKTEPAWNGLRRAFPHGHSVGIMFDPKRRLIWGTDTNSQVYVLRLSARSAGARILSEALPQPSK